MPKRLVPILVVIALVPVAGCGGDDSSDESKSPPATSVPEQAKDVPTDAKALKERCMDDLTKSGLSKADAEKSCTVPDEKDVDKQVDALVKSCLETTKMLPAGSERDKAEQECRDSGK